MRRLSVSLPLSEKVCNAGVTAEKTSSIRKPFCVSRDMPAAREPKMEDPTGLRQRAAALGIIQHFPVLCLSENVAGVRSTQVEKRRQKISCCDNNEKQERNRNGQSGAASQSFLIRSRRKNSKMLKSHPHAAPGRHHLHFSCGHSQYVPQNAMCLLWARSRRVQLNEYAPNAPQSTPTKAASCQCSEVSARMAPNLLQATLTT